jgi:aminopeptidase N
LASESIEPVRARRRALISLLVLLRVASSHAATAQEPRPYRPAFDVVDYALTIDLPDTGATIRANALLSVTRTGRSDTLVLDLLDLGVDRIMVDGRAAKFTRLPATIAIPLPRKGSGKAQYKVSIDYGGAVTDGLIVRTDSAGRWTYFGDNWPNRARHWIPSIDHPSDKATVTWRVRAPSGRTVVANGKLVSTHSVRDADGRERVESVWRESRRIPVYLMVIAAAPLERFDLGDTDCGLAELQRCVPQSVYTAPEQQGFLPGPFARAGEIVQLFSNLVGPFPYEKLSHLQSSTRFGGMENASAIFYSDEGFRRRSMTDEVVAHETAHQWFGDAVTERDWPHLWLSEGFATYFAALWTRAARGDSAFRVQMSGIRDAVLTDTSAVPKRPVVDTIETNLLALLNRNSYEKGGFVLHMLRGQVGERAFFDALRGYYAKHRHATAVTDDLRAEMERASRQSLGWFFDQWLRRPGYPEVTATWSYDAGTHEVVIRVTQSGRFGAFQFPVTVAAIDSAGVAHRATGQMAATTGATHQLRIPLAAAPASVELDPDVELLAALRVVHE